ncbi:MAG: beta-lactamase family protein [Chloroflexi bacterium]|nr:beta-lactamase family protein [Chloroflexota bacterium]
MADSPFDAALPRIREIIAAAIGRYGIPGAAAGIVSGDRLEWSQGFGFADLESRRPADVRSLFRVASITKTFTGAAIMQLRDAGRLSLDDPISRHIPEFGRAHAKRGDLDQVTIRRLLTHHSGLVSEAPFRYWETLDFPPFERILASLPKVEVVLDPDTQFKYSNLAFALLGEVITRTSKTPYAGYVAGNLLRPLGLASTTFELTPELGRRFATGYDADAYSDSPVRANHHPIGGLAAAGGLYSSVEDLAKWVSFQLSAYRATGDGGAGPGTALSSGASFSEGPGSQARSRTILSPATIREIHRPQILEPDWRAGYGLPWRSTRSGDRIYVNHGGGLPGHRTTVQFDPAHGIGFIFLTNLGWHDGPEDVAVPALNALNDAIAQRQPAVEVAPAAVPEQYRRLLGAYVARDVLFTNVEWRDAALRLVLPPGTRSLHAPARLEPTGDALAFEVVGGRGGGELAVFEAGPDGHVAAFALGGAVYRRLR